MSIDASIATIFGFGTIESISVVAHFMMKPPLVGARVSNIEEVARRFAYKTQLNRLES